jgi:hypothetical protein
MKASAIVPYRLYPYYLLIKLYQESGDMDKAKAMAKYALSKQIKIDSPAVQEMRKEIIRELLKIQNSALRSFDKMLIY